MATATILRQFSSFLQYFQQEQYNNQKWNIAHYNDFRHSQIYFDIIDVLNVYGILLFSKAYL